MADIGRNPIRGGGRGDTTREQREYAMERIPGLTPDERKVGERCGAYTGSDSWWECKDQVDRRGEDLSDTVDKARRAAAEEAVKERAARQVKFDKAMKAADAHIAAGDKAKAQAELKKAHDAADETGKELKVAEKAAALGDRDLAWDALYAAKNLADGPTAAERVAKAAGSLGFDDIADQAQEDAEDMRQEKAAKRAEEQAEKQPKAKSSTVPSHKSPEIRKSPVVELLTDPLTMGLVSYGVGMYLLSDDSGSAKTKTKRKR